MATTTIKLRIHDYHTTRIPTLEGVRKCQTLVSLYDLVSYGASIAEFKDVNPRRPKLNKKHKITRTQVIKDILQTLSEAPSTFVLRNQGITLLAESVGEIQERDNRRFVEIVLSDREQHGIINGLHTLTFAQEYAREAVDDLRDALVWLDIWTGTNKDAVPDMARGHNRSAQVEDGDIAELQKKHDIIKTAMSGTLWADEIRWKTGETRNDDDDTVKAIPVRLLVQLLEIFNLRRFPSSRHPVSVYSSPAFSERCYLRDYEEDKEYLSALATLLPDIVVLYDEIGERILSAPNHKALGQERDGKREANTGTTYLPFKNKTIKGRLWKGWVFPMLAAMRAGVQLGEGGLEWRVEWQRLLDDSFEAMYEKCKREHITNRLDADKLGKRESVYEDLYQLVAHQVDRRLKRAEIDLKDAEIARLRQLVESQD